MTDIELMIDSLFKSMRDSSCPLYIHEREWLDSINEWYEEKMFLTEAQCEKLARLYSKIQGKFHG